jgi:Putative metallopeptidase
MAKAPTPDASGRVVIRYEDAQTPEAQRGRQIMQDAKVLEQLSQHIEDSLVLPSDMGVVGKQCNTNNDFYDPSTTEIQLCYEAREHAEQLSAGSGSPDPTTPAVDEAISAAYHELGHATLAIYNLAFTGREEDVADQLSAFMLLTPGADGKPYPDGVRIATNTAQEWKLSAKESGDANELPFWDGHPMDIQRMYNWECWIYGSDPAANTSIVASGDLPEDRAGNCEGEFENMARGWQQLLGPHLRKPS